MKINLQKTPTDKHFFINIVTEWSVNFAKEYDVELHEARRYIMSDSVGQTKFCNYLSENRVLNVSPYELLESTGRLVASGFDIAEDELYTMALLKYTEENHA